ncbi:MAG: NAD-dependent epimerase/dehydratase family protein [Thermoplasmata archaeon]
MRALITGGNGFLGSRVSDALRTRGDHVTITHHRPLATPIGPGLTPLRLDVENGAQCEEVVRTSTPDLVIHFAGNASVSDSWEDPVAAFRTNLDGTLHLLEAVRHHAPSARFLFAGSGTEYGDSPLQPTPETAELRPGSPYAASKAAADLACAQYGRGFGLDVLRVRFFGVTGVGKRGDFCNDMASQVAQLEHAPNPSLRVGSLERRRDLLDGRDAARAVVAILERGVPGEAYNVGRGTAHRLDDVLGTMLARAATPFSVTSEPSRVRRADAPVQWADVTRLRALGWSPQIPLDQTLDEILAAWRERTTSPGSRGDRPA